MTVCRKHDKSKVNGGHHHDRYTAPRRRKTVCYRLEGKGYEKGHKSDLWLSLPQKVYRVDEPDKFITFEDQIMLDHTSFIDDLILSTHVLIEQKSYLDR